MLQEVGHAWSQQDNVRLGIIAEFFPFDVSIQLMSIRRPEGGGISTLAKTRLPGEKHSVSDSIVAVADGNKGDNKHYLSASRS